jgi:DNA-binding HxlR family transcriptional regulator
MDSTAQPGRPVRGSRTGRPIMALLDLLGRRWTLRLLWELRNGPLSFAALRRAADGLSQSVLVVRLDELRAAGIVEQVADGYALTARGRSLNSQLVKLDRWAQDWAEERR